MNQSRMTSVSRTERFDTVEQQPRADEPQPPVRSGQPQHPAGQPQPPAPQPPAPRLASEEIVVSAPMSFSGSAARIWHPLVWDRAKQTDNTWAKIGWYTLALSAIALAWLLGIGVRWNDSREEAKPLMASRPFNRFRTYGAALCATAAVLLLSPLILAARADAFVYWTSPNTGSIGRANLDGTGVNQNFIGAFNPWTGLAVDAEHLYWTSPFTPWMSRANIDGTGVNENFILANSGFGVAVDANHIYWTNASTPSIDRANLDGTDVETGFIPTSGAWGVAVDADHVYWTSPREFSGSIGRANIDGTGIDENFIAPPDGSPTNLTVDTNHIYWASRFTSSIGRANLDGTGVDVNFIPTAHPLPEGVAVDANHVYWANCAGCVTGTTIGRANLDGTGVDQNFITELGSAFGVAVDSPVPTDAATEVIVEGKTKSNKTRKEFVVQVTNAGTSSFTVSPDESLHWSR